MKPKQLLAIIILLITMLSFAVVKNENEQSVCSKLNYYFLLKQKTADTYWKGFNSQQVFGPMMYYGATATYVINPNPALLAKISFQLMPNCINGLMVGTITGNTDSARLNMQVDYDEEDSSLLYYKNPIASVSDISIAKKFISNFTNTEFWDAMVLHESFHLFQTSHPKFKVCQNETQQLFQRDTLLSFYTKLDWYKKSVAEENQLLLNAINCNSKDSVKYFIKDYLRVKKVRHKKILTAYKINIAALEDMLERSEGMARYMEFCMKRIVKELPRQVELESVDSFYHFGAYANYERKNDDVMNGVGKQYYYSTGLSLAMLFEKLEIEYQQTIYKDNRSFDWYLKKIKR
jgi:hypothetical protein